MNDAFDIGFFVGAAVGIVAMCLIWFGYAIGQDQIANHCKTFSAFEHGVIYECKEKK